MRISHYWDTCVPFLPWLLYRVVSDRVLDLRAHVSVRRPLGDLKQPDAVCVCLFLRSYLSKRCTPPAK